MCTSFLFYGKEQELLCSYNPFGKVKSEPQRFRVSLADNETLIGVYGAFKGKDYGAFEEDIIRPFGFIVKVMPVPE